MKKLRNFITLILLTLPTLLFSQKLRDKVRIDAGIYEVIYSEVLEQPLWVRYVVKCPNGDASRKGMDFYLVDSVKTSDHLDYVNNVYDKGHMAPAADFNCSREMLYKTFSYLNCSLQNQDLNRTTWRLLESRERLLAGEHPVVVVEINCVFSKSSIKLPTGATVPDGYYKTIRYGNKVEKYYFKNDKPTTLDYSKYLLK
jgi:endonuclease G